MEDGLQKRVRVRDRLARGAAAQVTDVSTGGYDFDVDDLTEDLEAHGVKYAMATPGTLTLLVSGRVWPGPLEPRVRCPIPLRTFRIGEDLPRPSR